MSDWMPGALTRPSSHNGGTMTGRDAYWVWHTFECGYNVSAMAGARSLIAAGNEVHFVFNPITGDIVQILPASVAGRGLRNSPGGVETNRQGRVCIQVEVIGRAANPWTRDLTAAGRAGLARLMAFADDHGVPRVFPAGPTPAYPSGSSPRSVAVWNGHGGHFGHSQVPENTHGDPGAIDCGLILAAGKTVAPAPAPAPTQTTQEFHVADINDAKVLWGADIIPAPSGSPANNPTWAPASYLRWTFEATKRIEAQNAALAAAVGAMAQANGLDPEKVQATIADAVDKALADLKIVRDA